jgi:hypothetical protein
VIGAEKNSTLYVRSLNEKIKLQGKHFFWRQFTYQLLSILEMKITLYHVFSAFGEIVEIVMKENNKMRG